MFLNYIYCNKEFTFYIETKSGLIARAEALFFINAAPFHLTYAYNKEQDFNAHAFLGAISKKHYFSTIMR